LDEDEARRIFQ